MGFKQDLRAGHPLLGTFLKTPHPHVVEVLASGGLDCLRIDAEHAPFDRQAIDLCVMAARAGGLQALVRPASGSSHELLNALDCGADGVLVPHIRSAEEASALARHAHYGPGGSVPERRPRRRHVHVPPGRRGRMARQRASACSCLRPTTPFCGRGRRACAWRQGCRTSHAHCLDKPCSVADSQRRTCRNVIACRKGRGRR